MTNGEVLTNFSDFIGTAMKSAIVIAIVWIGLTVYNYKRHRQIIRKLDNIERMIKDE